VGEKVVCGRVGNERRAGSEGAESVWVGNGRTESMRTGSMMAGSVKAGDGRIVRGRSSVWIWEAWLV